jgi:hypothetical protein
MTQTYHDSANQRNDEITDLTVQERQLRFRDEIEHARCSSMTHAERERVVRYVREFITIIYYPGILNDDTGYDVGDELDARIAEAAEAYYREQFPRIEVSPDEAEIGEYE